MGQKAALLGGGVVLLTSLVGIGKWAWNKYVKTVGRMNQLMRKITPVEQESAVGKVKRGHPRDWLSSIDQETKSTWS